MHRGGEVAYHTLDVFTDRPFGGNPLAVVPDARPLTPEQMQLIAAEVNLSETAFVLPPRAGGTHQVRIFTPTRELPFAGHPTIGTALLLRELEPARTSASRRFVFEEGVGEVSVMVRRDRGGAFAELEAADPAEIRPSPLEREDLAAVLSLRSEDLAEGKPGPCAASCGVPFLLVPVTDVAALGRARLDLTRWEAWLAGTWAPHLFPYVPPGHDGTPVRARMFAPALGIAEDPATGGAVAALGGLLAGLDAGPAARRWTVLQGVEMGRSSMIHVRTESRPDGSTAVFVGGRAVRMSRGELWL